MTTSLAKTEHTTRVLPAVLAEVARQPRLVAASVGTIAAGLATRRADLIRGGTRMLAVHVIASAARTAMTRHRTHEAAAGDDSITAASALSEAVVAGIVGWVAEAAVDAALKRLVPDGNVTPT